LVPAMKTKTTFELDASLLKHLKATAARAGKSVRDLLTEGAIEVLEKYDAKGDRATLKLRAADARRKFRGSFAGPGNLSSTIDSVIYAAAEGPPPYSPSKRRKN